MKILNEPIYDKNKSYQYNLINGPFFNEEIPTIPDVEKEKWVDFLGFKIRSRIGVPAGPLLSSKWIALASKMGFDILTYKTIRSKYAGGHKSPNIVFVETPNQFKTSDLNTNFTLKKTPVKKTGEIAITNSFGMPSMDPDFLIEDIKKAHASIKEGQIIIVSVVGSQSENTSLAEDFVNVSKLAKSAGAKIIEVNFSCPNVKSKEGILYKDSEQVFEIIQKIKNEIKETPLIVKLGFFETVESLQKTLVAISKAGASGIAGINSVSVAVQKEDGSPALGIGREKSGLCGNPIRNLALELTKNAKEIIENKSLNLKIIGMGGVSEPKHFNEFLQAGADITMTATTMLWHPQIAFEYKKEQQKNKLVSDLFEIGAIKFGGFTLKNGTLSPIYIDLRITVSYPKILMKIADALNELASNTDFDLICGVPYTALPFATAMSIKYNIPMVMRRKEAKKYGTKKIIEGAFESGQTCLIVEDLITSGSSVLETVEPLNDVGLNVTDVVILLDRQQGGRENLEKAGITVKSIFKISELLETLLNQNKISEQKFNEIQNYLYSTKIEKITIRKPDDFHVHLRRGQTLINVLPFTSAVFKRAVIMGNTTPPIKNSPDVISYKKEIGLHAHDGFTPIMSIMLTNSTTPKDIEDAFDAGAKVLKLIPEGTSTNSDEGVPLSLLKNYYNVLKIVQDLGMIFSGHWELIENPETGEKIPEIERETQAIPFLLKLIRDFPKLKIVVEHVTSKEMIQTVEQSPNNVSATISAHHPILTFDDVCNKDSDIINPLNYCKPIAKNEVDQKAIIKAMTSGNPKFFFGSDSAPHPINQKIDSQNCPAGIFSAPIALPLLCEIFENENALDKLEDFVSKFGAEFYGIPLNQESITLKKEQWNTPYEHNGIGIFKGKDKLNWQII
ncbi:MAG: dihydroorotase [Candidatus Magasanikbacteria bacterium]|nr:dihydroorotase [Candidatus Magasanikbacteria bacterium]